MHGSCQSQDSMYERFELMAHLEVLPVLPQAPHSKPILLHFLKCPFLASCITCHCWGTGCPAGQGPGHLGSGDAQALHATAC